MKQSCKQVMIGIIGLGTVGKSVARILQDQAKRIQARAGVEIRIKRAVVRNPHKHQDLGIPVSDRLEDLLEDSQISIIVELVGGVEYPFEIAKEIFKRGKGFVTANKAMLAYHMQDLLELSCGKPFGFEASVCGGIPIIEVLRDSFVANECFALEGILNGTSNFILSQMFEYNQDFSEALYEAQRLGYAEADPSLDINGGDAGHKLLILAKMAFGVNLSPQDILIEGIEGVSLEDMKVAYELGYKIKLLAIAKKVDEKLDLRVHLALLKQDKSLSQVSGVKNGISVYGDCVGEIFLSGFGAGGDATASAVIADLVNLVRLREFSPYPLPPFGFFQSFSNVELKSREEIQTQYYLRLFVVDQSGVLAEITSILADFNISVDQILQKETPQGMHIFILTHRTQEKQILLAIERLKTLKCLLQEPYKIRIQ